MAENILALIEMSVVFAMNAQEKLLLDVALAALIIVLVWTGWHHNRRNNHDNEPC
jgi:hypothetical protein